LHAKIVRLETQAAAVKACKRKRGGETPAKSTDLEQKVNKYMEENKRAALKIEALENEAVLTHRVTYR